MVAYAKNRGKYANPANEERPCPHGCGKVGRAGPIAYHAKYACSKRSSTVPPPVPVSSEGAAGGLRVEYGKVALRELPAFVQPAEGEGMA